MWRVISLILRLPFIALLCLMVPFSWAAGVYPGLVTTLAAALGVVMAFDPKGLWHRTPGNNSWKGKIGYTVLTAVLFIWGMAALGTSVPGKTSNTPNKEETTPAGLVGRRESEPNPEGPSAAGSPATEPAIAPTFTPVPPTSTPVPTHTPEPPTATVAPPTQTPEPPSPTPGTTKENAQYVDPRELTAEPRAFIGKNIFVQGRTLTVQHQDEQRGFLTRTPSQSQVQVLAGIRGRDTTESMMVEFFPKTPQILRDECYRFFGTVTGTRKVRFVFTGAETEVPVIRGYDWEEAPQGRFGFGCAPP